MNAAQAEAKNALERASLCDVKPDVRVIDGRPLLMNQSVLAERDRKAAAGTLNCSASPNPLLSLVIAAPPRAD